MKRTTLICTFFLALCLISAANGEDKKPLIDGLDNPTGVAVQSGTGHVFVATRDGVWRVDPKTGKASPEVTGYPEPTDIYGKGPKYPIGPLGLAFTKNGMLVVGGGGRKDGAELMHVYKVGKKPLKKGVQESKGTQLGPITAGEASKMGEGNFYGVAVGAGGIFVTCNGDDTKGWVSKAALEGKGKFGKLTPTIATKVATGVDAPVGITFSPKGDLVIGQMGEMNVPGDSLLTFYNAKTGKLKSKHKTGLHDIAGVAYSPKTGKLYVVDFGWIKNEDGGLYELTVEGEEVKTKKVASLTKPTALAFGKDGTCYVTVFGPGENEKKGAVMVFKGL